MINTNVFKENNEAFSKNIIRTIGATACLMMWLKIFYWMRLFDKTAHYVTLIVQTITNVEVFFIMLTIVMLAFANFFFIINSNSSANVNNIPEDWAEDDERKFYYIPDNTGNKIINSILTMWLLALGEFNLDGFN